MGELKWAPDGPNSYTDEIMFCPVGGGDGGSEGLAIDIEVIGLPSEPVPVIPAAMVIVASPPTADTVTGLMNVPLEPISAVKSWLTVTTPLIVLVTGGVVVVVGGAVVVGGTVIVVGGAVVVVVGGTVEVVGGVVLVVGGAVVVGRVVDVVGGVVLVVGGTVEVVGGTVI